MNTASANRAMDMSERSALVAPSALHRAPGMNEVGLLAAAKGGEKYGADIKGVVEYGL